MRTSISRTLLVTAFFTGQVQAQNAFDIQTLSEQQTKELAARMQSIENAKKEEKGKSEFLSSYFGLGLYAGFDTGKKQRIDSARVVNGIVRVEEQSDAQVGFMLEAHRIFALDNENHWGLGPYVGLVTSGEDLITAASIGLLLAMRPQNAERSLNVGLGFMVTPKAQVLGDGIEANQPLPVGETEVRMKKETIYGVALSVSFGF